MGNMRNSNRSLVSKPEGKRPLERPRCGWEYIVKMDLKEMDITVRNAFI
jgi:hypothetical protein